MRGIGDLVFFSLGATGLIAAIAWPAGPTPDKTEKLRFSRDILPILSDNCFQCHGPDAAARKASLRLDTAEGALADRSGRHAIVPGNPVASLVVQRISSRDAVMPPPGSGKVLTREQIGTLRRWIAEGAQYDRLWSFQPLAASVPVPKIASPWVKNDIDRFVLARLWREHLSPSPAADRLRWLRRVTLDLTGLPPTESEMSAFQADSRSDAFAQVVDRLEASPHFGERVAVDWLDAARYSDSYGYQSDLLSPTWPYRDWVVRAFNANLPYDRFLTDQIAGDLLPAPTRDEVLATAFNRLHRQSNEGGSIPLEFKTEYAADRTETFGTAVLGLTLNCARCHDHKYDPISQREYYQLFAYFDSIDEYGLLLSPEIVPTPSLLLPTPKQSAALRRVRMKDEEARRSLARASTECGPRYDKWVGTRPQSPVIPDLVAKFSLDRLDDGKYRNELADPAFVRPTGSPSTVHGVHGNAVHFDGDNGLAVHGIPAKERSDAFTWSFWVRDTLGANSPVSLLRRTGGTDVGFCGFDLTLEDGYLNARVMRHWPGNAVAVRTTSRIPRNEWANVAWSWDGGGRAAGLRLYVNGRPIETTVLADRLWKKIDAYGDLAPSGGDWAFGEQFREAGFKGGEVDEIAYATRALSPLEVAQLADGHSLADALRDADSNPKGLRDYFLTAIDPVSRAAQETLRGVQKELTGIEEGIQEVEVMQETARPTPTYLLARGRYDAPRTAQTLVGRAVPKCLVDPRAPFAGGKENDRLALAKWVTAPYNPLTARVAVNRFWQMLFGTGLVETPENFGVQGARPSHPELLDYLARRFVDSGWDVKRLFKEIVLSATYRQDSKLTARLREIDPKNRLLARGPSGRLPAEMIRDTALAASRLLNPKIGGPPVNPYQPAGIWQENNTMTEGFVQSKGADLYRRSLYSTWKRTTPVPNMMLFDATSREACTVRRPSTNTPLQALVLLNDIQFVEAARALAESVLAAPGVDDAHLRTLFRRLASRDPDARELEVLRQTWFEQRALFASGQQDPVKLLAVGDAKPTAVLDRAELAAMTVVAQVVLNSDAVVWKR